MNRRWSRYCDAHYHRLKRYGSPESRPVDSDALSTFERTAEAGLALYADRVAVHKAHELAQRILDYRAECGFSYELAIERSMSTLKARGVTARDVLRRVVAFAGFMRQNPAKFPAVNAERQGVARAVCSLLVPNPDRPGAQHLRHLGYMLIHSLFPFAVMLLDRLARDAAERAETIRQSTNFDQITNP